MLLSRAPSRASAAGKPLLASLGWPVPRLPKIYSRHITQTIPYLGTDFEFYDSKWYCRIGIGADGANATDSDNQN